MYDFLKPSFIFTGGDEQKMNETVAAFLKHILQRHFERKQNRSVVIMESADIVDYVCNMYIGPALCILGIFGNIFNIFVLFRGRLLDSPYVYLKALSFTDMFALILSLPYLLFTKHSDNFSPNVYNAYVFLPVVNLLTAASVWITVGVTIDRFIFVKFPLLARSYSSGSRVKRRIFTIYTFGILFTLPRYFCYSLVNDLGVYRMEFTPFRDSAYYRVYDIVCIIIYHFIPLVIFVVINTYLIVAVYRARFLRQELGIRNNREQDWQIEQRRFTITLIGIIVISIVAIFPSTISDFSRLTNLSLHEYKLLRNISNLLLLCNLSMNFVLFCAFNKRFVRAIRTIFNKRRNKTRIYISFKSRTRSSRSDTCVVTRQHSFISACKM